MASAPSLKTFYVTYQSKNFLTGLTDVKANIALNTVSKATGLVMTALDATNSPGVYYLAITPAMQTSYGISASQFNDLEVTVNSVTAPLEGFSRLQVTVATLDDIANLIGVPASTSVSADILALQTSLSTVAANVTSLQNASLGQGIGLALPSLIIPPSGSSTIKVPLSIQNSNGALVDPTNNTVTIGVSNQAGSDRGNYLTGSSGTPATVAATRVSTGQYYFNLVLPSTAIEEEFIFNIAYTVGANSIVRYPIAQVVYDVNTTALAQQSTLLAVQTAVNNTNSIVSNGTYGNSALQSLLTAIEGSGFVTAQNSLVAQTALSNQIYTYLQTYLVQGGKVI